MEAMVCSREGGQRGRGLHVNHIYFCKIWIFNLCLHFFFYTFKILRNLKIKQMWNLKGFGGAELYQLKGEHINHQPIHVPERACSSHSGKSGLWLWGRKASWAGASLVHDPQQATWVMGMVVCFCNPRLRQEDHELETEVHSKIPQKKKKGAAWVS